LGIPRSQRTTGHPVRPRLRPRPPGRRLRQQPWRRPGRPRRAGPASATTTFLMRPAAFWASTTRPPASPATSLPWPCRLLSTRVDQHS